MGDIDEVSSAIGKLEGSVDALKDSIAAAERSRAVMHETLNGVVATQATIAQTLTALTNTVERISDKVSRHEETRQQFQGAKTLMISVVGTGSMLTLWKAFEHWWAK